MFIVTDKEMIHQHNMWNNLEVYGNGIMAIPKRWFIALVSWRYADSQKSHQYSTVQQTRPESVRFRLNC